MHCRVQIHHEELELCLCVLAGLSVRPIEELWMHCSVFFLELPQEAPSSHNRVIRVVYNNQSVVPQQSSATRGVGQCSRQHPSYKVSLSVTSLCHLAVTKAVKLLSPTSCLGYYYYYYY